MCFELNGSSSHSYKLKVDTSEKGSAKQKRLLNLGINYLYVCLSFFTAKIMS